MSNHAVEVPASWRRLHLARTSMRVSTTLVIAAIGSCIAGSSRLAAQSAVLSGIVVHDSAGHEIPGAELTMPDLKRSTIANSLGEFRFARLPAGRHALVIRHLGFAALYDTLDIGDGAHIEREFMLSEQATELDSVRINAPARKYISPALSEFEERRKAGFGHFITEEELRKNDDHPLINVLVGRIPGIKVFPVNKRLGIEYISTGRKCAAGPAFNCKGPSECPVTLYVDGVLVYTAGGPIEPPDMRSYDTRHYAAVEYYAGGATTPARYNATSSGCGVLLLWPRER